MRASARRYWNPTRRCRYSPTSSPAAGDARPPAHGELGGRGIAESTESSGERRKPFERTREMGAGPRRPGVPRLHPCVVMASHPSPAGGSGNRAIKSRSASRSQTRVKEEARPFRRRAAAALPSPSWSRTSPRSRSWAIVIVESLTARDRKRMRSMTPKNSPGALNGPLEPSALTVAGPPEMVDPRTRCADHTANALSLSTNGMARTGTPERQES